MWWGDTEGASGTIAGGLTEECRPEEVRGVA